MNRRAFLSGLLASGAAVVTGLAGETAAPVPFIAPASAAVEIDLHALLYARMHDCYKLMAQQMAENLFGRVTTRAAPSVAAPLYAPYGNGLGRYVRKPITHAVMLRRDTA